MPPEQRTHYRIERANGGLLCDLWFLTKGCIHDACGGCTMCNYGKGCGKVPQDRILQEIERIIEKLPWEFEDFLLTPSGSMLDDREVPPGMKEDLIKLLKNVKTKRFIIETRADTVTKESVEFLKRAMPYAEKYVEIGYECGNNWILRNCINKGTTVEMFEEAVEIIHDAGAKVTANVALGIPFLSEKGAICEAVDSVKKAFLYGADSIVLFPYHVKHGTMMEVLYENGLYQCVSLWSCVEVLSRCPLDLLERIQISWYKDYFGEKRSNIYVSSSTCSKCSKEVLRLLDEYRENPSKNVLEKLAAYNCECKERWREKLLKENENIEFDKIEKIYRLLAEMYNIDKEVLDMELFVMRKTL